MPNSYVCSGAAAERGEQQFATGSRVGAWLLIEVAGAWGIDAIHESALGDFVPADWKNRLRQRHIRAVCIRSYDTGSTEGIRLFTCVARRPGATPPRLWHRQVASLADVVGIAEPLDPTSTEPDGWQSIEQSMFLVCTNGRHDQCCANQGRPLIRALRESPWADRVWECSHIGGDRFAANVVVLPHSLYFGRVEPTSAPAILGAIDDGRIDIDHFRGRTTYSLAEQAVEHFVRLELGVDGCDAVIVRQRRDDGTFLVDVGDDQLAIRIRRRMISVAEPLTCRGTAGQLVPSFTLESIRSHPRTAPEPPRE